MRLLRRPHAASQPLDAAVADYADVARGEPELDAHGLRRSLVVEGHHEHSALALGQALEAPAEAACIERLPTPIDERGQVGRERLEEPLATQPAAPPVDHHLPAGAENERGEPLRLADFAGAELLQDHEQHVLDEIGRGGLVAQVPQAIEADAGRKPPAELRLRGGVPVRCGRSNAPRELRVVVLRGGGCRTRSAYGL